MNEQQLYKLWNHLQTASEDFGTFEEFKTKMSTPELRKRFYNAYDEKLRKEKIDLGDYVDFESRLG